MAFSKNFLNGLETKSQEFQNEFFGVMDMLYSYLENDEEIQEFQQMIEESITYYGKGNLLWWQKTDIGGDMTPERGKEYLSELHKKLVELFVYECTPNDDGTYEPQNGSLEATEIIIGAHFPEEIMSYEVAEELYSVIEQYRPDDPPSLTVINNSNAEYASFCIVMMK
uniref:Uncharacterized protein n=1 Tax=uncultured Bacillota bacterium TaxID=344338 RepID=A0A650EP08_9FIRM|nr:hypothetical protein Firmicute1046_1370 [uncultured Firmicutes bacterium]